MIGFSAAYFCFYIFKITPVAYNNSMSQNAETVQRLMPVSATKIATLFVLFLLPHGRLLSASGIVITIIAR